MGKKARLKAIKNLAANMPMINEHTNEKHELFGSEILSWGTIKEIDGKPIDPDKKYLYNFPVMMIQNNRRRMKKAFLKGGEEGIKHYLQQTLNVVKSNIKS
jgi:hypothetical protein